MTDRKRNEKGQFLPGNKEGISTELARDYQARSAEVRKRNRTLREVTLAALQQDGGGGLTRMEHLVLKAMDNHRKGKLSFRDLKDLSAILGEQTLNVKTDGPRLLVVDEETLQAAAKWSSKQQNSQPEPQD